MTYDESDPNGIASNIMLEKVECKDGACSNFNMIDKLNDLLTSIKAAYEANKNSSIYREVEVRYRAPALVGFGQTFYNTDIVYFKVNFPTDNPFDDSNNYQYVEGDATVNLTYVGELSDGAILFVKDHTQSLNTGGASYTLTGGGSIKLRNGSVNLVNGSSSGTLTSDIIVEPFEAFLNDTRLRELMGANNSSRRYNNVYYIDLITIDRAGNRTVETRTVRSPYWSKLSEKQRGEWLHRGSFDLHRTRDCRA